MLGNLCQIFPTMYNLSGPIKKFGIENNDLGFQFLLYGQAASLNKEMKADTLIRALAEEPRRVSNKLVS